MLELFGPDHRREQVDDEAEGDNSNEDVFHGSELSTRMRV